MIRVELDRFGGFLRSSQNQEPGRRSDRGWGVLDQFIRLHSWAVLVLRPVILLGIGFIIIAYVNGRISNSLPCSILSRRFPLEYRRRCRLLLIQYLLDPAGSTILDLSSLGTLQGSDLCRSSGPFSCFLYSLPVQFWFLGWACFPYSSFWLGKATSLGLGIPLFAGSMHPLMLCGGLCCRRDPVVVGTHRWPIEHIWLKDAVFLSVVGLGTFLFLGLWFWLGISWSHPRRILLAVFIQAD